MHTVTHDDLIDFAREIIERTKEMNDAEKAETSASVEDGYYTCEKVRDRIWKSEIRMKEVTPPEHSKGIGQKK